MNARPSRPAVPGARAGAAASASTPAPARFPFAPFAALAAAAVAWFVFHGALGYFFAQDDFAGLARARGILPALEGPWRWISGQLYFDVMRALAGLEAAPYRAVSLAAHAAVSAGLALVLARRYGPAAALAGATFFAAHPGLYTALYSVSGIGEILAAGFALAAIAAFGARGAARWLAPAAFALSLLCKENTLLLPFALALMAATGAFGAPGAAAPPAPGGRPARRAFDPVLGATFAVAALGAALLLAGDAFGVRAGLPGSAAYSAGAGRHVVENLLTYAGWTIHIAFPLVRGVTDAVDPPAMPWGAALLAAWAAGLPVPALRRRGWLAAGALGALWLAPVLPLENHTYRYYLYAPLLAAGGAVAIAFDAAREALAQLGARVRPAAPRPAGALGAAAAAVALAGLLAANGAALVRRNETMPLGATGLLADPTVDRAIIARNVRDGLARAALPEGSRLAIWCPRTFQPGLAAAAAADTARDTYYEANLRSALMEGVAVRVMFPAVHEVRFARAFAPDPARPLWAVARNDGMVQVRPQEDLARMLAARPDIR